MYDLIEQILCVLCKGRQGAVCMECSHLRRMASHSKDQSNGGFYFVFKNGVLREGAAPTISLLKGHLKGKHGNCKSGKREQ